MEKIGVVKDVFDVGSPKSPLSPSDLSTRALKDPLAWERLTRKARRSSFANMAPVDTEEPIKSPRLKSPRTPQTTTSAASNGSPAAAAAAVRSPQSRSHHSHYADTATIRSRSRPRDEKYDETVDLLFESCEKQTPQKIEDAKRKLAHALRPRDPYQQTQVLCSMAVVVKRKLRNTTTGDDATRNLVLRTLDETGVFERCSDALFQEQSILPESSGGRAALAILTDAAPHVASVSTSAAKNLIGFCHVTRGVMKDATLPAEVRCDAAQLVVNVSTKRPGIKDSIDKQDNTLIKDAEALVNEFSKQRLACMGNVRRKTKVDDLESNTVPLLKSKQSEDFTLSPRLRMRHDEVVGVGIELSPSAIIKKRKKSDANANAPDIVAFEKKFESWSSNKNIRAPNHQVAVETAQLLCSACKVAKTKKFVEADGHELLLELMKRSTESPEVLGACLEAFACGANDNPIIRDFCLKSVFPSVEPTAAAADPKAAQSYVSLMADCIIKRKNQRAEGPLVADNPKMLRQQLETFIGAWETTRHAHKIELQETLHFLKCALAEEESGLTLKQIHQRLVTRESNQESMSIAEDRTVRILFDYVCETMEVYARSLCDDPQSFIASEIMHGCLCFQVLLSADYDNGKAFINGKVPELLIKSMKFHMNPTIAQHYVITAVETGKLCPDIPLTMSQLDDGALTVAEVVRRGRDAVHHLTAVEMEDILDARLELVQMMAINRRIFSTTKIMDYLITLWDDVDRFYYNTIRFKNQAELIHFAKKHGVRRKDTVSPFKKRNAVKKENTPATNTTTGSSAGALQRRASLVAAQEAKKGYATKRGTSVGSLASDLSSAGGQHSDWEQEQIEDEIAMMTPVLKTMRYVICGQFTQCMKDASIPSRLVGLILDPATSRSALPHALFLIGALAAVPELKDAFGEYGAIEHILNLIRKCYKIEAQYVSEIVCNGCLALASLCVIHGSNTAKFAKHRGSELVVKVLKRRGEFNDARGVNGASALICNLCFKNEDMKKELGLKGACQALVHVLNEYKSSSSSQYSERGTKCISSTFKAIGNLSLNPKNMEFFLEANVPDAYAGFLEKMDDCLDDATMEACFRTLANLVIEKDNMQRFMGSVVPTLTVMRKLVNNNGKVSAEVIRWMFEAMGNLCRYPTSAGIFTQHQGIETILSIAPRLPDDPSLHAGAIFVLGIQTTEKANIPTLMNAGILNFTKKLLDNYKDALVSFRDSGGNLATMEPVTVTDSDDDTTTLNPPGAQLPVSALRCTRRVLTNATYCSEFVKMGGFNSLIDVICLAYSRSMVCYEALRIFFITLAFLNNDPLVEQLGSQNQNEQPIARRNSLLGNNKVTTQRAGHMAALVKKASIFPVEQMKVEQPKQGFMARMSMRAGGGAPAPTSGKSVLGSDGKVLRLSPFLTAKMYDMYDEADEPRTRLPIGDRAWKLAGMTEEMVEKLIIAIRLALSEDKVARNLRLYRLGVGVLTYFACEKVGFEALYRTLEQSEDTLIAPKKWETTRRKSLIAVDDDSPKAVVEPVQKRKSMIQTLFHRKNTKNNKGKLTTDSSFGTKRPKDATAVLDLIFHIFTTLKGDGLILESAVILLFHMILCATNGDEVEAVADKKFYNEVKEVLFKDDAALDAAKEALKLYRTMLEKGYDMSADDLQPFYHLVDFEFPLELSGFLEDPYPDGPQSLPPEVKTFLRTGGKLELFDITTKPGSKSVTAERKWFIWKSSHDLLCFQWRLEEKYETAQQQQETRFPFSTPISLTTGVLPGTPLANFHAYAKQESIPVGCCLTLVGQKSADFPNGFTFALKAKSQKERDAVVSVLSVWRDSAAYGFR